MIDLIKNIVSHSNEIWAQILVAVAAFGAFLKGVEAVISLIAPLTPWKFDNDLADMLAKITTAKLFNKKNS